MFSINRSAYVSKQCILIETVVMEKRQFVLELIYSRLTTWHLFYIYMIMFIISIKKIMKGTSALVTEKAHSMYVNVSDTISDCRGRYASAFINKSN